MSGNSSLTKKDISKIAQLAQIAIDQGDIETYAIDLSHTLDLIAKMDRLDTKNVVPMTHPINCVQRFRADRVGETCQREKLQKIAPKIEDGLYLVPKVIE